MGRVQSHFLDSGAFTLWTKASKWAKENGRGRWDYYDTNEFWQYMDDYAAFVKKYRVAIDLYANVDAIPNPEITWRNQKYLEDTHGLSPVPVVHYPTDLKWLRRYIKCGYDLIGLGGLVGKSGQQGCRCWMDQCFDLVCDSRNRLPRVKIHGFGITTFYMMRRYPWWSVDSVSWAKIGAFGNILVPPKRKGRFSFEELPFVISMSDDSPNSKVRGKHYATMVGKEKILVREWLSSIGVPMGRSEGGEVVEYGVLNRHTERRKACLLYFEAFRRSLPEWPWPFTRNIRRGLFL